MKAKLRIIALTLSALLTFGLSFTPALVHADPLDQVCASGGNGSVVCNERTKTSNPIYGPGGILTKAVQIIIYIIGITSVIMVIINGLRYVLSNGDPQTVNSAKNGIIYALVGVVIAILAQTIVTFVLNKL